MKKVVSFALALVLVLGLAAMALAATNNAAGVDPELKAYFEELGLKSNASGWSPKSNTTIGNFGYLRK